MTPGPAPVQPGPSTQVSFRRQGHFIGGHVAGWFWRAQAWSPDGSLLALGGRNQSGEKGELRLWDGNSGQHGSRKVRLLADDLANRQIVSLSWSPDSKYLASAGVTLPDNQRSVYIRSQAEKARPIPLPPDLAVSRVAWSPDGGLLALGGIGQPRTALVDPASGAVRRVLEDLTWPCAWQAGGRLVACVRGTSVWLIDPATGEPAFRLAQQTKPQATALAWSRNGKRLAVADGAETVVYTQEEDSSWRYRRLLWAAAEGDRGPDGTVRDLQWLDGGNYLLEFRPKGGVWRDELGTTVASISLRDAETGQWLCSEQAMQFDERGRQPSAGIVAAPDGRRVAVVNDHLAPLILEVHGDLPNFVR